MVHMPGNDAHGHRDISRIILLYKLSLQSLMLGHGLGLYKAKKICLGLAARGLGLATQDLGIALPSLGLVKGPCTSLWPN